MGLLKNMNTSFCSLVLGINTNIKSLEVRGVGDNISFCDNMAACPPSSSKVNASHNPSLATSGNAHSNEKFLYTSR
ncbi:hypothetical protein EB796_023718 [Bugula neritina]|uniref:Uncharacterized protein n=1 Tax=Bugula neritina TaxID=10212 RepID=A0A7J7IXL3_BUGNE|nr:hypothetical protein EB796_023718 [Bugula neritina]